MFPEEVGKLRRADTLQPAAILFQFLGMAVPICRERTSLHAPLASVEFSGVHRCKTIQAHPLARSTFRISRKSFCVEIPSIDCNIIKWLDRMTTQLNNRDQARWPTTGDLNFWVQPELSAAVCPAVWRAVDTPSVVIFGCGPQGGAVNQLPDLGTFHIVTDARTEAGTHLVLQNRHGRHRLLIRDNGSFCTTGFVLAPDKWFEVRSAATLALHYAAQTSSTKASRSLLAPSRYQRHRLSLMLDILDFIQVCGANRPTIRDIAKEIVYPRHLLPRAIEWKSSTQRRATFRLVNHAVQMRATGYKTLLTGSLKT